MKFKKEFTIVGDTFFKKLVVGPFKTSDMNKITIFLFSFFTFERFVQ